MKKKITYWKEQMKYLQKMFMETKEDCYGRTIEKIDMTGGYGGKMLIIFTDHTFTVLGADRDYDGDASVVFDSFPDMDYFHSVGFITDEQVEQRAMEDFYHRARANSARERAEYERLKKKFEEAE